MFRTHSPTESSARLTKLVSFKVDRRIKDHWIYAGSDELHSVSYITEKGDKIWIKMDASRPCKFSTTETR